MVVPMINKWVAILALPFTSKLFIKSFPYFRQLAVMLSANYGFINVVEMLKFLLMCRWPREGAIKKAIRQHRVERQVVSSHTWCDQLCWKHFHFYRLAIKSMPQTFLACVEAGMCDCMPLSERFACIHERGVPVSCPDSVKQVMWIP